MIVEQGRLTNDHAKRLYDEVLALVDGRVIEIVPRSLYAHMERWPVGGFLATPTTGRRWLSPSTPAS